MLNIILLVGAPTVTDVERACAKLHEGLEANQQGIDASFTTAYSSLSDDQSTGQNNAVAPGAKFLIGLSQQLPFLSSFTAHANLPISSSHAQWRLVKPAQTPLRTNLSQKDWQLWTPMEWAQNCSTIPPSNDSATEPATSFEIDHSPGSMTRTQDPETAFLERSFALHSDASTTQLTPVASFASATTSFDTIITVSSSPSTESDSQPRSSPLLPKSAKKGPAEPHHFPAIRPPIPREPPTPLAQLPDANRLLKAAPTTLTVTLLVAIVTLKPPRPITLRKTGKEAQLVEAIVADDSGAPAFGLSLWLHDSPAALGRGQVPRDGTRKAASLVETLGQQVGALSVGDIVIVTNLALAQWKGRVYGTSLARKGWRTAVLRVWSRRRRWSQLGRKIVNVETKRNAFGDEAWRERAVKVKQWAERNVVPSDGNNGVQYERLGPGGVGHQRGEGKKRKWMPEDDTQET